ncbi:MAG: hypothetical protein ACT4N5_00515 [Nitrosopumilaceae archaeon]
MNSKADKNLQDDLGHDEDEWGLKDDSEVIEWEKHYNERNKKWRFKEEPEVD